MHDGIPHSLLPRAAETETASLPMLPPVVKVPSCHRIGPAQKREAYTPCDDMEAAVLSGRGDL